MINFNKQACSPPQRTEIQSNKDKTQEYSIKQQIGQGTEGIVYLGQDTKQELVAIKFQYILNQEEILERLSQVNFSNIINIKDIIHTQEGVFIIMDYADGEFYNYMKTEVYFQKNPREKTELFLQIVKGVDELHKQQIIHRDLKPENVLYIKKPNQQLQLKLCDFGLIKYKPQNNFATANIGTPYYWAPELVSNEFNAKYSEKIDIWALGMIWIEMLIGEPLFNFVRTAEEMKNQLKKLTQGDINGYIDRISLLSQMEKDLLKQKILIKEWSQRISAEQMQSEILNLLNPAVKSPFQTIFFKTEPQKQNIPPQFNNQSVPLNKYPAFQQTLQNPCIQPRIGNIEKNQNSFHVPSNSLQQFQQPPAQQFQFQPKQLIQNNQPIFKLSNSPDNSFNQQLQIDRKKNNEQDQFLIPNQTPQFKEQDSLSIKATQIQQNSQSFEQKINQQNEEIVKLTKDNQELQKVIEQKHTELKEITKKFDEAKQAIQNFQQNDSSQQEKEQFMYRLQIQILQQQSNYFQVCLEKANKCKYQSLTDSYRKLIQDLQLENSKQLEDITQQQFSYKFFNQYLKIQEKIRNERQVMKNKMKEQEQIDEQKLKEFIQKQKKKGKKTEEKAQNDFIQIINQISTLNKYQVEERFFYSYSAQLFKLQKKFFKHFYQIKNFTLDQSIQTQQQDIEQKYSQEIEIFQEQFNILLQTCEKKFHQKLNSEIQIILEGLSQNFNIIDVVKKKMDTINDNYKKLNQELQQLQQKSNEAFEKEGKDFLSSYSNYGLYDFTKKQQEQFLKIERFQTTINNSLQEVNKQIQQFPQQNLKMLQQFYRQKLCELIEKFLSNTLNKIGNEKQAFQGQEDN